MTNDLIIIIHVHLCNTQPGYYSYSSSTTKSLFKLLHSAFNQLLTPPSIPSFLSHSLPPSLPPSLASSLTPSFPPSLPPCRTTTNTGLMFCPSCGNRSLYKVSVVVDSQGILHYRSLSQKQFSHKGLRVNKAGGMMYYYAIGRQRRNSQCIRSSFLSA